MCQRFAVADNLPLPGYLVSHLVSGCRSHAHTCWGSDPKFDPAHKALYRPPSRPRRLFCNFTREHREPTARRRRGFLASRIRFRLGLSSPNPTLVIKLTKASSPISRTTDCSLLCQKSRTLHPKRSRFLGQQSAAPTDIANILTNRRGRTLSTSVTNALTTTSANSGTNCASTEQPTFHVCGVRGFIALRR